MTALDRWALRTIEALSDGAKNPDTGKPYSLKDQANIFTLAQNWLAKREKMGPAGEDDIVGVVEMRAAVMRGVEDEIERQVAAGLLVRTRKPNGKRAVGRPRKEVAAAEAHVVDLARRLNETSEEEVDDSLLRKQLRKGA